jgi:CheY-like chemotaxis protein
MGKNEIDKIFERFEQANITTHVTYGGSGLGLFISKELTERMAGEIGVRSHPGRGSMFVFYIKTRRTDMQTPVEVPSRPIALQLPPKPARPLQLRTLLVEDNIINQRVLRNHLERCHCAVTVANHGVEALDILRKPDAQFDILLMDMQMPIMDGLTCTREIRALEKQGTLEGRVPIIAVTANVRNEQVEEAMEAGADRVVQKPFKAKELVEIMRDLVGGKDMSSQ